MAETDAKQKEKMVISLLVLAVLMLGCAWSFMQFQKTQAILSGENSIQMQEVPPQEDTASKEEISEVQKTNTALSSIGEARKQSMQTALLAEATGRLPIADIEMIPALRVAVIQTDPEAVIEESPPAITVRAVLLLGSTTIATVDIAGEGDGVIVQPGTRFDGSNGRIISIDSKGVKYQWKKKRYVASFTQ